MLFRRDVPIMVKIISLFNHKGGVSKTTTAFNIGWILAEKGKRILLVDTDPQCNLTGLALNLSYQDDFQIFYTSNGNHNIKSCLSPVFEGKPEAIKAANCFELPNRNNLFLLPGHINFSDYDVSLNIAQNLTGSLLFTQNIPGAISHLLRTTAKTYNLDYIIIDMSPSISATNANILMQSDYFIMPCSPDFFCDMAVDSLSQILPFWNETYKSIKQNHVFSQADYKLPDSTPKFIGTIFQRYRPRNGSPTKSFQTWIDKIATNVTHKLVPILRNNDMMISEDKFFGKINPDEPYNIINISDFNSLIAQSQKYNVPVFSLTDEQLEQVGNVQTNMKKNREDFYNTFSALAESIIFLTK